MAAFNFHRRKTRRWWYAGATLMVAAFFTVFYVAGAGADNASGCDFAATGTTESCVGPLTDSTFAGGDGNLLASPTTFGTTDWQNVAGLNTGIDLPSGSTDNSFGQGTKEDSPNVSVVTGSIPPQKSDLTRFYEASELANGSNFLYLGWERTNNLGSANMDFEINQKTQPDLTTTGPKTLDRTAGDLLVTFDFTNGGGRPAVSLMRWLTSATTPSGVPGYPTNVCFSANSFPCWGDQILGNSSDSEAAVNNLDAVTDPFLSNTPNNVGALRFGETAINLTSAGVFPAGTCTAFGSAFLKSRSSASFPAEVKDFVAPVPVNIANCGEFKIIKSGKDKNCTAAGTPTITNGVCTGAGTANLKGAVFTVSGGPTTVANQTTGDDGTVCVKALATGTYTVTESTAPTGYKKDATSQDVVVASTSTCSNKTATFTDAPLTDLTVHVASRVSGATNSNIKCVNTDPANFSTGTDIGNSPQPSASTNGDPETVTADATHPSGGGLTPGTYTCKIVIDP
jgi:hypothetical protein